MTGCGPAGAGMSRGAAGAPLCPRSRRPSARERLRLAACGCWPNLDARFCLYSFAVIPEGSCQGSRSDHLAREPRDLDFFGLAAAASSSAPMSLASSSARNWNFVGWFTSSRESMKSLYWTIFRKSLVTTFTVCTARASTKSSVLLAMAARASRPTLFTSLSARITRCSRLMGRGMALAVGPSSAPEEHSSDEFSSRGRFRTRACG
mmetsp:Transcript_1440/g.4184  ORF Transcript_1440/g.4184 Transcript_1440/m.4184 type:complete len:206 (+) Transcript_1440:89-706(+)